MRVFAGLNAIRRAPRRAVVTVGVFDGVHRAHQHVIRTAVRQAHRLRGTSVVVTFDPDPQTVLTPAHAPSALMPLAARIEQFKRLGVDWVWIIPFTKRFSHMPAERFVQRMLLRALRAEALVVGDAFVFGRDRRGDMAVLRELGTAHGMRVLSVPSIMRGDAPVSSSRIRRLISIGRLAHAGRLLGRPPALYGTVVRGVGRGHRIGFPTANVRLTSHVLPPRGVYAVLTHAMPARLSSATSRWRPWRGVMNLGVRPTFGHGPLTCEVHLLDFSGNLHGRPLCLSLLARLRGERRFPTPEALSRQIQRDVARARHLFTLRS